MEQRVDFDLIRANETIHALEELIRGMGYEITYAPCKKELETTVSGVQLLVWHKPHLSSFGALRTLKEFAEK